jgi:hypothetical protein
MRRRPLLHALWFASACAIGCSLLIDPSDKHPLCAMNELGQANVCPQGLQCQNGVCDKACNPGVPDVCNDNIDNDCDGTIDEMDKEGRDTCGDGIDNDCDNKVDENSDGDHDGFSWCGATGVRDGGLTDLPDCDDGIAAVHPGAVEVCDGRDNDCNMLVDDPGPNTPLCQGGSVCFNQRCITPSCVNEGTALMMCGTSDRCDPSTGNCVSKKCADVTCAANELCDEVSKTCVKKQPLENGLPCLDSPDCASGSCVDGPALRLTTSARVCAKACCDDLQCGTDERCFASGTGARSCLPVRQLPKMAERECTTDRACLANEVCQLSKDKQLTPPTFIARTDVITSTCKPNLPTLSVVGDRCTSYTMCTSHVCVPGVLFGSLCSNACGTSNDCRDLTSSVKKTAGGDAYCRYADVTLQVNASPDYAPICVVRRPGETGPGEYGAECAKASDCLEAGCVGATSDKPGHCTPTCCQDSDCGPREDRVEVHCRPFAFGTRYEMRCEI